MGRRRALDASGVTSFHALHAPLLVDSYALEGRVFEAGIPSRMLEPVETIGLVPVAVLPGPLRKPMGVAHAFARPDDFTGAVFGHAESTVTGRTMEALGAAPTTVPAQTPLDGLDGIDDPLGTMPDYIDRAGFVTANLNLSPRAVAVVMNRRSFDALTPSQQDAVLTAAPTASTLPWPGHAPTTRRPVRSCAARERTSSKRHPTTSRS